MLAPIAAVFVAPCKRTATRGCAGVVPQQRGRGVEIINHDIEITIAIEIGQGHAQRNGRKIEAPVRAAFGEGQVPFVPKSQVRRTQLRKHLSQVKLFQGGEFSLAPAFLDLVQDVDVHVVPLKTSRDEQVLVAIQIHIQEDRCPRPFARVESAELRDLRVSPVAAIEKQCVTGNLRTLFDCTDWKWFGLRSLFVAHAAACGHGSTCRAQ